ncbi:hypothetical protein HW555_005311 [Spodoptera exigua]|uniref:HTH psq-type domain-containing protein n=1 Tax=Spodoptera exigua TaxID=7107 RepID=A0A835GKA7_SPOEX|nr:hypothetical protein HW555_005311 [Spodoptera exigua]
MEHFMTKSHENFLTFIPIENVEGWQYRFDILLIEIRKEKATDPRRWTKENMKKAIKDVVSKKMGVNEASRTYEIPTRIE